MVHKAFDGNCVVKDCPARIESAIAAGSGCVIAGCMDGSLRIYEQQQQQLVSDEEDERGGTSSWGKPYVLRRTVVGFSKKSVSQMDVCQSRASMLITLSDAIAVHSLPDLEPIAYLQKTRGASLFCWDEARALLCVGKQRRLVVYRHEGRRDFAELKDLPVPDVIKSMAWSGECLCIGVKREYLLCNINTGTMSDIFPCGRIAPPLVTSLPDGQLLLGKDNIGVLVDHNGKVTQQGALSWSEAPASVVAYPPYVLAHFPRFIEVRTLREPYGLVQMIPLRDIQFFQSSCFGLLAGSEQAVFKLEPVPLGVQVVQLAASGNFEDALALCKLFPPEDAALRSSKEESIRIRYGDFLLERSQFVEALQQFGMSSLAIGSIASRFPLISLPHFCDKELKGVGDVEDNDAVYTDELSEPHQNSNSSLIALTALASFLSNKRSSVLEKARAQETNQAIAHLVERRFDSKNMYKAETSDARSSATVLDTVLVQALLLTNQSPAACNLLRDVNYCDVQTCQNMMLAGGHFSELLELYRYNKMHQEALELLKRLIEEPESFPVPPQRDQYGPDFVLEYLRPLAAEDPHLLLEFSSLILRVCPEKAMSLFTSTDPPLQPSLVLSKLKKHAPDLQLLYMEEMIKHNPESLSVDVQNDLVQLYLSQVVEEKDRLDCEGKWSEDEYTDARKKLLNALESFPAYSAQVLFRRLPADALYEERALLFGRMKQHQLALSLYVHKLHDPEKAVKYCERVSHLSKLSSRKAPLLHRSAEGEENVYLMLLEIYLKPKIAIRNLNSATFRLSVGKLKPERATNKMVKGVAKKVTQIEEAHSYDDISNAESSRSDSEESFEGEGVMVDEAVRLLCTKWECFDGNQVLDMVPSDVRLQDVVPFLEPFLLRSTENSRSTSIVKRLQYSDKIGVRYELLQQRKRVVKVTNEQTCSICRKKIGNSVFAVYPNGRLSHFVCYSSSRQA